MRKRREQHAKIVYWSNEDNCYIGQCPTLFGGGVHGADETKVWNELCEVVADWEADDKRASKRGPRTGGRRFHGRSIG